MDNRPAYTSLTAQQASQFIRETSRTAAFRQANQHLTQAELNGLNADPIVWPQDKPLFTEASWKGEGRYSKITIRNCRTGDAPAHRLAYIALYGTIIDNQEISHTVWMGDRTTRNFNPITLVQESRQLNDTRRLCHQFIDKMLWDWVNGALGAANWGVVELSSYIGAQMGQCGMLHGEMRCAFSYMHWRADTTGMGLGEVRLD